MLQEVLTANDAYARPSAPRASSPFRPLAASPSSPVWTPGSIRPSTPGSVKATPTSSATRAAERASDDAIRSLVISYKLLGTKEWFVIHHTNCGMEFFTDEVMRGLLANSLETAALGEGGFFDVGTGPGSAEAKYIDWLTISDSAQSVTDDVNRIRSHPLVPTSIPIHGYIYDVTSGRLVEVPEASKAGHTRAL